MSTSLPGFDRSDPHSRVAWSDDETFGQILERINQRLTRGDVPLNLSATSLVTNAYLYTGDERYKQWVLDYLGAWEERCRANDGIMPDNIGPSGDIGELMDGKWWGGYYGWRWPHGARNIVEPALVAGSCALLLTGDFSHLELARSQLDMLWENRREEDGQFKVPARRGDGGWFDFRPPDPYLYIHLYYLSQSPDDLARIDEIFPERDGFVGLPEDWGAGKAGICPPKAWFAFTEGGNAGYPDQVFASTHSSICHSLERLAADNSDPETRECYHFQRLNPVVPEALIQMAMGTPAAIYNGGMLQAHVRYFDPTLRRAGLPQHVAALVDKVGADGVSLTLVNTDPVAGCPVLLQAGSFGEHCFTSARLEGGDGDAEVAVDDRHLQVELGPAAQVHLHLGLRRFAGRPSYDLPEFD